jgi:large subunit ribosomal protein L10
MKTKQQKGADLERLAGDFGGTKAAFVVEFKGLKVVAVDELRRKVREAGGSYQVVKNTLARKASAGTALEIASKQFRGPTAVVKADADPARVAKVLSEFAKANPAVIVKAGVMEGTLLDAAACKSVADLPSREELLSKLAYLLQSPMQRLAVVLNAPSRNLAVALGQVAEKKNA